MGGLTFAVGQFVCSNYISVELTDIVAALAARSARWWLFLRVWQPADPLQVEEPRARAGRRSPVPRRTTSAHEEAVRRREGTG